ncbi:MAG: hypothetical protein LBG77_08600 [Dysgonamonadaceae bacterium]|jgi:hypothetical protein|nr:hypothetical protein [Dysgonamonadaceae bacterium]
MIDPKQRKELIILLKILQDETKWDKIYAYADRVLRETDDFDYPATVNEPVAEYGTGKQELWLTEEEADEILDTYESRKGQSALSSNDWLEIVEMAEYYDKHPEELIPWADVEAEMDKLLYA